MYSIVRGIGHAYAIGRMIIHLDNPHRVGSAEQEHRIDGRAPIAAGVANAGDHMAGSING